MQCLPQELVDAILNHVNDHQTFKSCSLVASSFVSQSQKHLFHTIDLDALTPRRKAYARFVRLLTLNPHLGTYVRSLRLGDDSDDFGSSSRSWIIHAKKTLPQLFQLLPRLEAFSLTFNSDEMNWKSIPAEIRSAIGRLFRLPTLQAVSLEFILGFPPQLLFGLMRLNQLSLSCVDLDSNDVVHSHSASELRGLHLRGTPPPVITAISHCLPESSPTLRRLAITPTLEPGFCSAISELMKAVGSNITHFEWLPSIHFCTCSFSFFFSIHTQKPTHPPSLAPSSIPIDISRLPHLRFLKFVISFRKFRSRGHFTEMLHLLDQVSTHADNKIEIIELECNLMRWLDHKSLKAQWRPLENVLDKAGFRNKLKEIRVGLSVSTNASIDRGRIAIGFMDLFHSLRERGVVISVQDNQGDTKLDRFLSLYFF